MTANEKDVSDVTTNPMAGRDSLDALLAAYAAGALSPSLHALVAAHLELSGRNVAYVAALEALAADEVEQTAPVPLRSGRAALDRILADRQPIESPLRRGDLPSDILPSPLRHVIGRDLKDVAWRSVMPGLKEFHLKALPGEEASLLWIKAGRRMPSHTHEGSEITLVLQGAFSDKTGRYGRGDIAIADAELDHRPVAEPGEDCICFAVTDAPLRLTGPVGRIVQRLFGH